MDQARPHPRQLVGDDARPNATATDGHATSHLPTRDCTGQRHDKIWIIVIRVQSAVAEVDYLMAGRTQPSDELFLQFKSAVVCGNADALERSRHSRQRLIACSVH